MREGGREGRREERRIGRRGAGRKMSLVCQLGEWEKKRRNLNRLTSRLGLDTNHTLYTDHSIIHTPHSTLRTLYQNIKKKL